MNRHHRLISNLVGFLADMLRLSMGRQINLHGYMKYVVLRDLGRRTSARCLIESGTYLGVTARRCSKAFEHVLTIELDPKLATEAAAYLSSLHNVEVLQGDATRLLPEIIARDVAREAVVFLDGHFSGGETALGEVSEPAILEMEILARHSDRICGIVVDDFRLFGIEPGFPSKAQLVSAAERMFPYPRFELKVHSDQLIVERRSV